MNLLSSIYLLVLCGRGFCMADNELLSDLDLRPDVDNGDEIMAAIEQELSEAIIKVISNEDSDTQGKERYFSLNTI